MAQYFDLLKNHQRLFCVKRNPAVLAYLFFVSCVLLQPVIANAATTRCELKKPSLCPDHISSNWTVINDDYDGAGQDQVKCLKRAAGYYNWCGYHAGEVVSATYYENNKLKQKLTYQPTRCEIEKPVNCPANPSENQWEFNYDNYEGSNQDEAKCLKRAGGYYNWCGYHAGEVVSAAFYEDNKLKHKLTYQPTRCEIEKPAGCPLHSGQDQWQFNYDNYNGSSQNREQCLERAKGYYNWCGFAENQTVSAAFYQDNNLRQKLVYKPTRCEIQKPADCPGNTSMDGSLYYDRDQGSDVNEQVCLAQAKVIYNTCAYVGVETVSATFYRNGVMGKQKLYKGQRCEIRKPALCPNRTDLNWEVNPDSFDGVDPDINLCMNKVQEYHLLCGYFKGETVSAAFYEGGQKRQESSFSGSYCQIQKPTGCPLHSEGNQWELNYDIFQGSNLDKEKCLARAESYRSWCGYANGETVTASFFSEGNLLGQASSVAQLPTVKLISNTTSVSLDDELILNVKASSAASGVEAKWNIESSAGNASVKIDEQTDDLASMKDSASCLSEGSMCSYTHRIQFTQPGNYTIKGYAKAIYGSSADVSAPVSGGALDQITIKVFSNNDYPVAASYFVSPGGNDNNNGSMNAPFKTVERARDKVREINKSMTGDIIVNIREGLYYVNPPIKFGPMDSGNNGFNVVYKSYDGIGNARFIGGKAVTSGWQSYKNGIYYTDIVGVPPFFTFFENGRRAYRARYPNRQFEKYFPTAQAPYLLTTSADVSNTTTVPPKGKWVRFLASDLGSLSLPDLMGDQLRVHISNYGKADWGRIVTKVSSIDQESAFPGYVKLSFNKEDYYAYVNLGNESVGARNRFFFLDDLELLDAPGEFYFDNAKGRLYYQPYESVYTSWMVYPIVDRSFHIYGTSSDQLAQNIVFDGLAFEFGNTIPDGGSDWVEDKALLYLIYTKNIKIKNCHLSHAKNGAVIRNSQFISLTNSLFNDMANSGIVLKETHDSVLANLRIHDVGTLGLYAQGIGLFNSSRNQIVHDEIFNSARYAITSRGNVKTQYDVDKVYSPESPSQNNIFKYLKIFNANQDSGDTGALHSAGVNYDGDSNINFYDQIMINNWDPNQTTQSSVQDPSKPNGIFLDWPDATMNQVFRNINIVGYQDNGIPFRTHGNGNKDSAVKDNVSWEGDFNPALMEYGKIGLTAGFPQEFSDSRLIAKWSFEKFAANGTINQDVDQFDYSGMDAPAVLHNSPGPAALAYSGVRGKGIHFDGIDDYASSAFRLNANQDFTIMVWAKYEQQTSGGSVFRPLVYSGTDMGNDGIAITAYREDCKDRSRLGFRAGNFKVFDAPLPDGQWHMIALTRKGYEFRAYFDGALLGKWDYYDDVNAHELTIAGDPAHSTRRFKGFLDELNIYNYALPANMLAYLHAVDRSGGTFNLVRINARRSFGSIEDKTVFGNDLPPEVVQRENRDNQIWSKIDVGGGYFRLRNMMTGNYLHSQGANAPIVCKPYENTDSQLWKISPANVDSYVYLSSKDSPTQVVQLGGAYGGIMNKADLTNSSYKHFVFENVTDVRY